MSCSEHECFQSETPKLYYKGTHGVHDAESNLKYSTEDRLWWLMKPPIPK